MNLCLKILQVLLYAKNNQSLKKIVIWALDSFKKIYFLYQLTFD